LAETFDAPFLSLSRVVSIWVDRRGLAALRERGTGCVIDSRARYARSSIQISALQIALWREAERLGSSTRPSKRFIVLI